MVREVLIALIAGGHVLIEGVPGLGKTLLVRSLGKVLELEPANVEALWFSALAAIGTGDKARARGFFDRALAELPEGSQERAELQAQAERMLAGE